MDFQGSALLKAARLCLADTRSEKAAVRVLEYLEGDDWEAALLLLEDLGDVYPQPPEFWSLLADAARLMWLKRDADWYAWRSSEARSGALRAELCLMRTEDGGRKGPVLPRGVLRPLWDIGRLTSEGEPLLSIALLWAEGYGRLEPGACAPVRLLPLRPEHWQHLKPGDVITMHEVRPPAGTARIIEVMPPVVAAP
ncbi:hypothetical protein AB0F17_47260 [Nonomuraea sp. NPDC026600]|uniref:hypothetical protein n=1 Tax=Nonomuraea sp. NPDC026600 TaxID=3155363 RepID=UPI0033C97ECB